MRSNSAAIFCILLTGFVGSAQSAGNRWYNDTQVVQGQAIFQSNCASCHGVDANPLDVSDKSMNAPALNGSAHSWHHSLSQLRKTVQMGGKQLGGKMPGFKDKLSDDEIDSVIAFFQAKWPEETYSKWSDRFVQKVVENKADDIARFLKLRVDPDSIAPISETEIEGVYQTKFGGSYAYLFNDGRYVFVGELFDLQKGRNITEVSRREDVRDVLLNVPESSTIIYPAQGVERTVLNVFTDTSCGFCQKLHKEVGFLQEAGISVRYFPFPRGGNRGPGYKDLKSVWCSEDPLEAMDIAKRTRTGQLIEGDCSKAQFVDDGFDIGRKLGINGTPALFSAKGTKFDGYVPHTRLIPLLLNEL